MLGLLVWSSPTTKIRLGMAKVCVPPLTNDDVRTQLDLMKYVASGRGGKRKRSELNFIEYNLDAQTLKLVVNIARFNNDTHIGGASVGQPPDSDTPVKYTLLKQRWVPASETAPVHAQLKATYPGGPTAERPHWS